jgi:hypothetical protein
LIFVPLQDVPVGFDAVQILDGGRRLGGDDLRSAVRFIGKGDAFDRVTAIQPLARIDRADDFYEDFFAFAARDRVDPGRFREHLLEHEGGVDAPQDRNGVGTLLLGDLQHPLGLVDRRRDAGRPDHIGLQIANPAREFVIFDVIGHRVDEDDVIVPRLSDGAGKISGPGRRPVAGDLGSAGVVIGVDEQEAHGFTHHSL